MRAKRKSEDLELVHPDAAHALRARMWQSAHPDAVQRVAKLIGGDPEMAAFLLAGHKGTVDELCTALERKLRKLANQLFDEAKQATPVDTGVLKRSSRTTTR